MKSSTILQTFAAALLATTPLFGTVLKPVGVTTTITGDAGSSHLYLLDDNGGFAAAGLQDDLAAAITLDTGDTITKAICTFGARGGGAHAESWTRPIGLGNPVFVFDLTGVGDTAIGSAILWQYGNNGGPGLTDGGNSTREFSLIFHTEAEGNTFDFGTETADFSGVMDIISGNNTIDNVAQPYFFGAQSTVRYVALRIDSNYLGQPGVTAGGDRYGLGEVRFATEFVVDPVIEAPSSITIANNGSLETIQVTITNGGATQDLTVTNATVTGLDAPNITVTTSFGSPLVIGPGLSADIDIQVDGTALFPAPTQIEAALEITSDGWFKPTISVPINGLVRNPWIDTVATIDLGTILPTAGVQNFTIDVNNLGATADLNVTDGFFLTGPDFSVDDDLITTPLVVGAAGTGQVNLSFDAGGFAGVFNDTLQLDSDDAAEPSRFVNFTINVERDPEISAPLTFDLGTFAHGSGPQNVAIQIDNVATTNDLVLSPDPLFVAGNTANFTVDTFDTPIAAAGNGNVNIIFDPSGAAGCYSATLEIETNDPGQQFTVIEVTATVTPLSLPGDLIAWWTLDNDLDPGNDSSGNGFHGTETAALTAAAGANGSTGGSLTFDGATHIEVPWCDSINPTSFTVTLWACPTVSGGAHRSPITSRDDAPGATYGFILYSDPASTWSFWSGDGDAGWQSFTNGGAVTVSAWTHIAMSYDANTGTKSIYVNGVLADSDVGAGTYIPNGPQMEGLHIGGGGDDGASFRYTGKLDDVALFASALSLGDIGTIMNQGVSGFLNPPALPMELVSNGYDSGTGNLSISVNNIPAGTYHLRSSVNPDTTPFAPMAPVIDFDSTTPQPILVPVTPGSDPVLLLQVFSGPS